MDNYKSIQNRSFKSVEAIKELKAKGNIEDSGEALLKQLNFHSYQEYLTENICPFLQGISFQILPRKKYIDNQELLLFMI